MKVTKKINKYFGTESLNTTDAIFLSLMKLQKQLSKKTNKKLYFKWIVSIPPKKIKEAGLKEGQELDIEIQGNKIILEPKEEQ